MNQIINFNFTFELKTTNKERICNGMVFVPLSREGKFFVLYCCLTTGFPCGHLLTNF